MKVDGYSLISRAPAFIERSQAGDHFSCFPYGVHEVCSIGYRNGEHACCRTLHNNSAGEECTQECIAILCLHNKPSHIHAAAHIRDVYIPRITMRIR
jgi:hypothetical protein